MNLTWATVSRAFAKIYKMADIVAFDDNLTNDNATMPDEYVAQSSLEIEMESNGYTDEEHGLPVAIEPSVDQEEVDLIPEQSASVNVEENKAGNDEDMPVGVVLDFVEENNLPVDNDCILVNEEDKVLDHDVALSVVEPTSSRNESIVEPEIKQKLEPKNMIIWREEMKRRIQEQDEAEEVKKTEWLENARKELQDWESRRLEFIEKSKTENRLSNEAFMKNLQDENNKIGFISGSSEKSDGVEEKSTSEWDNISKLCDFHARGRPAKDVSRMRSALLQLKQSTFQPKILK